jgi:hypothetical protein
MKEKMCKNIISQFNFSLDVNIKIVLKKIKSNNTPFKYLTRKIEKCFFNVFQTHSAFSQYINNSFFSSSPFAYQNCLSKRENV